MKVITQFVSQVLPPSYDRACSHWADVFVIFDQLPLTSIMADDDTIDVAHYPGFAALAADATWYRNATTVAEQREVADDA